MKPSISTLIIVPTIVVLAGCAAKPIVKGDSAPQPKNATFPKEGQQIHVVNGGLVHLRTDYTSRFSYRLTKPLTMGFMLGRINVSTEDSLAEADLDGGNAYCTMRKVYSDPLTGPLAKACFVSAEKGKFSQIKAAPGSYWFTKDLNPAIDYVGAEIPMISGSKPLKRELVYEGSQNGNLFFTEKLYEISLDSPSKAKPLLAKIDAIPAQVSLNGAILNVVGYTANSLTFTLQKAWE
jgi:hypothetical protein